MWSNILEWVKKIFGVKQTEMTKDVMQRNESFAKSYEDTEGLNVVSIISNKLAGICTYESNVHIEENNARSEALNDLLQKFWNKKIKKAISDTLGNGGVFVIPLLVENKITEEVIPQNRVIINKAIAGELYNITVMSEKVKINDNKTYYRLTDHILENNIYTIRQRAVNESGQEVPLTDVSKWAMLTEEYSIGNVTKMPIAFFKSPTSGRNNVTEYGFPITYGQNTIVKAINDILNMLLREYQTKKSFIGADERLFDENNEIVSGIFKKLHGDSDSFWQEYSPEIRDISIINGLDYLFKLLEHGIGASNGLITKAETQGATATEIKALMKDTAILIDNIRTMVEEQIDNLVYGWNIWMENANITVNGEYEVIYDWDLSFLESTTETFNQLQVGKSLGVISDERLNMYITGNNQEQAQEELNYIKENQPTLRQLGVIEENVE